MLSADDRAWLEQFLVEYRELLEWFDEPDDLDRVQRAVDSIADLEDVVESAAALAYRVTHAQGFGEGNKRTALALAKWLLDRNGENGSQLLPTDDRVVADLLVAAAGRRRPTPAPSPPPNHTASSALDTGAACVACSRSPMRSRKASAAAGPNLVTVTPDP